MARIISGHFNQIMPKITSVSSIIPTEARVFLVFLSDDYDVTDGTYSFLRIRRIIVVSSIAINTVRKSKTPT